MERIGIRDPLPSRPMEHETSVRLMLSDENRYKVPKACSSRNVCEVQMDGRFCARGRYSANHANKKLNNYLTYNRLSVVITVF